MGSRYKLEDLHLRGSLLLEMARMTLQMLLIGFCMLSTWLLVMSYAMDISPALVPFKLFLDTFGTRLTVAVWWMDPLPLMRRQQYEQRDNFWQAFLFSSDTLLGAFQDYGFRTWNWVVESAWHGSLPLRLLFLVVAAVSWPLFLQWIPNGSMRILQETLFKSRLWLRWLPESLLTMEQLVVARDVYGRKFSAKVVEELEAERARDAEESDGAWADTGPER